MALPLARWLYGPAISGMGSILSRNCRLTEPANTFRSFTEAQLSYRLTDVSHPPQT